MNILKPLLRQNQIALHIKQNKYYKNKNLNKKIYKTMKSIAYSIHGDDEEGEAEDRERGGSVDDEEG